MKASIVLVSMALALLDYSWAVCMGIDVVSSEKEILANGPFVGELRLTLEKEKQGERFPSIKHGGISISIVKPNGQVVVVNQKTVYGGGFGNYWFQNIDPLDAGEYIIPFFLLKIREDFLFSENGEYLITFELSFNDDVFIGSDKIEVSSCSDCGLEKYLGLFWEDTSYVTPNAEGLRTNPLGQDFGGYKKMADLVFLSCVNFGYVSFVLNSGIEELEEDLRFLEKTDNFAVGYQLSRELQVGQEWWEFLYRKVRALENKDYSSFPGKDPSPTRRYILMR